MKRCLADVNVFLALLVVQHEFHASARRWFEGLGAGEAGVCRLVQLGVVRLLATPAVMGKYAMSCAAAWDVVEQLAEDERVDFAPEPQGLESQLRDFLRNAAPAGKLVTDAYLAAFAVTSSWPVVTLDRGFRKFANLQVQLLSR